MSRFAPAGADPQGSNEKLASGWPTSGASAAFNGSRNRGANGTPGRRRPVVKPVSVVLPEKVSWLWPQRIPQGKLGVLDGDPGLGKSTVALDLAARLSTGSPMPDGSRLNEPRAVVLLSAEDGVADTIRPRLEAAGADLDRINVFESVSTNEGQELPEIPVDIAGLEEVVSHYQAALVVVDPLTAFLSGQTDAHRDQDVRRALHPLTAMADRTGAAVLVVRHLSKSGGTHALYRGGGSIGIVGAARVGLLVAPDPDDADRRILAVTKCNVAKMAPAMAYRLISDEEHGCARVCWEAQLPTSPPTCW